MNNDATNRREGANDEQAASSEGGTALVTYGSVQLALADGESLSIGRQSSCAIRIGSPDVGPEDLGVSRRAATISLAQGRIWIRNDSTSLPVFVRPFVGPEYVLEGRGDMLSLIDGVIDVAFEGQVRSYQVKVELPSGGEIGDAEAPATVAPATQSALPLTSRERRLLAALCEPLLTGSGRDAQPASYRQIAEKVGLSEHTVRNALDALRERLASIGIPGMIGTEAKDNLARYAVRSTSVTRADLEYLQ